MDMHQLHHHHHHHLPDSVSSSSPAPAATEFDAIFSGYSLQSLLLGEPVLLTPPPPPFPPTPTPTTTFSLPLPLCDTRVFRHPQPLPPPTFFFQADAQKQRRPPLRRSSPQYSSSSTRNHVTAPPRQQRQKVSDKLKDLRRIVPCDKKADIATMLEQAYRYVRFLEAQVLALLTMKLCTLEDRHEGGRGLWLGDGTSEIERRMIEAVGRMSRQEVVEAVVNSGTAQKVMYEEGVCLVSEEQVRVLGWATTFQKQQQQQQQQQLSGLIYADLGNDDNNNNNNDSCHSYSYSN